MLRGETRPLGGMDETIESEGGGQLLPDVGDYVQIDRESKHSGAPPIFGRVQRRLFFYSLLPSGDVCNVKITVEAETSPPPRA